jgi:ElaB/YqjD/DUF883 family membrane-anchored ribosome-binding protein
MQRDIADTCQDIEDTRSAITEKLEILEERVRETVEGAQSSVEDIVENIRETVGDTVETVKRTLDVPYQVDQHPWLMVGGATLAGYLLGSWGGGSTSPALSTNDSESSAAGTTADRSASHAKHDCLPPSDSESSVHPQLLQGMGSSVLEQLKDEIAIIKVAAVGALISTLREMVKQAVPTLAPHIERARSRRGGQPLESPPQQPAPMSRAGVNGGAI